MSHCVVTFGEIMLRLNPEGYMRFIQSDRFCATYAGAEANVAVALAMLGIDTRFVTKVPKHEIGQSAVNAVRKYGVDTRFMVRGGDRLGIYFLEKGASQRASKVIYDRAGSSVAASVPEDYNWDEIFDGADWFHFTGITPALSALMPDICLQACAEAKKRGIRVSCDLNYRKKLWTTEQAKKTMSELLKYVDVCIANEEDAKDVLGIEAENTDVTKGQLNRDGYVSVARQICEEYGCSKVAFTLRVSKSASDNDWAGMLFDAASGKASFSPTYSMHIVDRVGGGDSFGGALIYGMLTDMDDEKAIGFAAAASCLKHTVEGDFNLVSVEEVQALANGNASGRVQR